MAIEGAIFSPRQLIDEHKNFNSDSLEAAVQALGPCGKQYYTVAIIGCQNSGKSTILNHLFGTNFKVLHGEAGQRTTRGVILGKDKEANLMVMDVEGNDSYESHLTGDENYERMVSSFALVGANVLLVNVWEKQVGQHSGSQYETLSIVMRICIDQFKLESPKTILFCLRDSNTPEYGQGELKRKLQQDVMKLWRDVWAGAKKTALSDKYQSTPERFFTLEVAFLREYDVDYPEDFEADIQKLRERFLVPTVPGYLFRKQNQEYNLPVRDLAPLFSHIWESLINHKELNLPSEKVQLANYRCEQTAEELKKKFETGIDEQAGLRNYGALLDQLSAEFKEATSSYAKNISEKWELELIDRVKAKIRKAVNEAIELKQKEIQQNFAREVEHVFYDPAHSFKAEVQLLHLAATEAQVEFFKQLNFEIPNRKDRIDALSAKMKELEKAEEEHKLEWSHQQFESDGQRAVRLLSAAAVKDHFGLEFWGQLGELFRNRKEELLQELNKRLEWARGKGASANQLDKAEENLTDWLQIQVKKEFEKNLGEKLIEYFLKNFTEDQHGVRYDYSLMSDEIVVEHFSEAKEMALNLLDRINDFTLTFNKRSSYIDAEMSQETTNPFLGAGQILSHRQNLQKRANEEYAVVMRRRNEARMKKIPNYLYLLIFYFVYDDIWFTAEDSPFLHYSFSILLVLGLLPLALGQGALLHQAFNMVADSAQKLYQTGKSRLSQKTEDKKPKQQ